MISVLWEHFDATHGHDVGFDGEQGKNQVILTNKSIANPFETEIICKQRTSTYQPAGIHQIC